MACLRRAILDVFWSRESNTVSSNKGVVRRGLVATADFRLTGPYLAPGPLPAFDHCGYEVACPMLRASIKPGKHSAEYTQFDSIRRYATAYGNQARALGLANRRVLSLGCDYGKYQRLMEDPAASFWMMRFKTGCKRRMGQDWRPDEAISSNLMKAVVKLLDRKIFWSQSQEEASKWIAARAYFMTLYVFSLRGPEGLLADISGLTSSVRDGLLHATWYVTYALMGKVKGETHKRHQKMYSVATTSSGLAVRRAVEALLWIQTQEGPVAGPAICDATGLVWTTQLANAILHELLETLFAIDPKLFPKRIDSLGKSRELYHVF
jgi:hypothetical protein